MLLIYAESYLNTFFILLTFALKIVIIFTVNLKILSVHAKPSYRDKKNTLINCILLQKKKFVNEERTA